MLKFCLECGKTYLLSGDQIVKAYTWQRSGLYVMLSVTIRSDEEIVLKFSSEDKTKKALSQLESVMSGNGGFFEIVEC